MALFWQKQQRVPLNWLAETPKTSLVPLISVCISMLAAIASSISAYYSSRQSDVMTKVERSKTQLSYLKDYVVAAQVLCASYNFGIGFNEYRVTTGVELEIPPDFRGTVRNRTENDTGRRITVLIEYIGIGSPKPIKLSKAFNPLEDDYHLKMALLQSSVNETETYPNRLSDIIAKGYDQSINEIRNYKGNDPKEVVYMAAMLFDECASNIGKTIKQFDKAARSESLL